MLEIQSINYLGASEATVDSPARGLIVASFQLEECDNIEKYSEFLLCLKNFVDDYNSNSEKEKESS